jgi:hypothetical protein
MSDFVQKENSGNLFKNTDKTTENPNWADYQGEVNVKGTLFYLSAWVKEGKNGKFFSLALKEKGRQTISEPSKSEPVACAPVNFDEDANHDIPF